MNPTSVKDKLEEKNTSYDLGDGSVWTQTIFLNNTYGK